MGGQKNSLTDPPTNLKEAIDWLALVGGKDKESNGDDNKRKLPAAVSALGDYGTAETILKADSTGGTFGRIAEGLQKFIGYSSSYELDGSGIGLSALMSYTSAYNRNAKWNNGGGSHETYAAILLSSTPLVYFGITFVYWKCTNGGWREQVIGGSDNAGLYHFLLAMEYESEKLNNSMKGQTVMNKVGSTIDDFTKVPASDSSTYPDFLQKLHQKGAVARSVMDFPFYKLFAASHAYLRSKVKHAKIMDLPQTQSEIAKTLKGYSEAVTKLGAAKAKKLSDAYNTLLSQIKEAFDQDPPAPPSSSAGAAAGGVLGTAAIGGTAAALATNVGGVTTTIKNFIPIFK
ncbi:variant erythrocyte surface antigen-1 family protein [Babesia caballi]|uniref:Variant erythrocyte surface antigen-1 family protein n=1 Tax=Babesia caballi TaxID=5871 RepID=A0AAV4LRM3_BABCB|nr:variant erythrocyte surface antigen-1 family protein [Babesia caballi]